MKASVAIRQSQRLREVLTSALDFIQSGEQMGPGPSDRGHLARVGDCLSCGEPVAQHWDTANRFLGCLHARMVARRAARVLPEEQPSVRGEGSRERGGQ